MRYNDFILVLLSLIFLAGNLNAGRVYSAFANVRLSRIIDGDTFTVDLPCSDEVFCKDISVRVRGVDTPELKSKNAQKRQAALKAKEFTKNFLESGQVDLLKCGRDKYFRLLCDVTSDGEDLASALLKAGLARSYFGGKKQQ